jgi:TolB protein
MPKTFSPIPALIIILGFVVVPLVGCAQPVTATPVVETVTPTEEFIPVVQKNAQEIVIFSYEEDGYAHLFMYIPDKLPPTRITSGAWDDITPAPSPDGERIAFASNRGGFWDLYLLDLTSGDVTQLTNTSEYEGAPTWSPDGSYLAFEAYENENLNIIVGAANDPLSSVIHLTTSSASDHSPAWAPDGRHIAFISDGEVILADLDKSDSERFQNISNTDLASESHPVWSPDGTRLAWASEAQTMGQSGIYIWHATRDVPGSWIGPGNWPAWNAAGDRIITTLAAPNSTYITTYTPDGQLLQALTPFPAPILRGLIWGNLVMPTELPDKFQQAADLTPASLWAAAGEPASEGVSDRWTLVDLKDVQAPYPQVHDLVDEAFNALRERVINEAGWDALAALENAYVPITSSLDPGFGEDWLYTGRAFAINSLMTNAGWMVAVREDFGAQTYWRLYLRAQLQDGSQGEPLRDTPWDLSARYDLDPKYYEQGGKYSDVPPGYWVDVTSLALQYGWERVPALPNWRTFYRGARFTEFTLTDGLDWYTAMLQLYPPDVLVTPTKVMAPTLTPTRTPTPTPTRRPTRTRQPTITPGPSPTVSHTPLPTNTPLPAPSTATPPTVIP